ncbi:MAG: peptide deformylase [Rhodospirillaceae bacterium]|jgi:peptide deformylase|nr:peptide deformylase [Rhodospirillaceae bacterium]
MAVLPILTAPHHRLKLKAEPVEKIDAAICQLIDDMLETMYAAPGIGLAAPQVNILKRLLVIDLTKENEPHTPFCMINPELIWLSDEKSTYKEGCLSVPRHYADVVRPASIRVRFSDRYNKTNEIVADDRLATVIQHEIDHLDGILFFDHLTDLKRNIIIRKLIKIKKTKPVGVKF